MTTSGTTAFTMTARDLVTFALRKINVTSSPDQVDPEDADRARLNEASGDKRFSPEHKHVQRVAVIPKSLRDKTVICRIVHRGIEYAIILDQPGIFVELVFHARKQWNLDDHIERIFVAVRNVVP